MVTLQTIGSIDMPGKGPRKMPAPRNYVAIIVTWSVLQLASDMSERATRATKTIGWIIVLVGMVMGPFGKLVTNLFTSVATEYGASPSSAAPAPYPTPIQPTRVR